MSIVTPSDKWSPETLWGRKIGHLRARAGWCQSPSGEGLMRHTWLAVAILAALSVSRPTHAATKPGSWTNGGMLGTDTGALFATVGFPGLSIGYLRGLSDTLDVGGRFTFNYGGEGIPNKTALGLKIAAEAKLKPDLGMPFSIILRAQPGLGLYFPTGFNFVLLQVPVEAALGFEPIPNLGAHLSVEVPLGLQFWSGLGTSITEIQLPVLFGGGVELKLDPALSVTGQLHMGPYVQVTLGTITETYFAMDALIGVTYRLP